MKLSILTPAVPSRLGQVQELCANISKQIGSLPVEHLVLLDNKKRSVGAKRDALLRASRGQFVTYVDDDDSIAPNYVEALYRAICSGPVDVVTFRQIATCDGRSTEVHFCLGNPNEAANFGGITKRNAWHVCAWRRELAVLSHFPESNYGEDWAFAAPLCGIQGLREIHIPEVLHYYVHSSKTTEAPPPK